MKKFIFILIILWSSNTGYSQIVIIDHTDTLVKSIFSKQTLNNLENNAKLDSITSIELFVPDVKSNNTSIDICDSIYNLEFNSVVYLTPDTLNLKTTLLEPITTAFVTAAGIGAIKGAVEYGIGTISHGEAFSGSTLAAFMTIGAAEGMTFLAVHLFGGPVLDLALGLYDSDDIKDYFVNLLEGFYDFIGNTISNGWQVLSRSFNDEVNNQASNMGDRVNSTVQSLLSSNGFDPEYSILLPYWVDFNETIESNASLSYLGMEYDTNYGTWKMTFPGISYLEILFDLDIVPTNAYVSLLHLTSYSENSENNGYSPVDIFINGVRFKDNYDVALRYGDHSWHTDNWPVDSYLRTGSNTLRIEFENDPWATTFYWIRNISIQEGEFINLEPQLTNYNFEPLNGDQNTDFEFIVDYYDTNDDKPIKAQIYIPGVHSEFHNMTLKSGSEYNGSYSYTTKLPIGNNFSHMFSFTNILNQEVSSGFLDGPSVFNSSNMTIIPYLDCGVDETYDIDLRYRFNDDPSKTVMLKVGKNEAISISPQSRVSLSLSYSENYTFENYRLMQNGELEREFGGNGVEFSFTEYASGTFKLLINLLYTPQDYRVSGTINNEDNTVYSNSLNISLESSQENRSITSNNGIFSFENVKGGIPIKINATGAPNGYSINPEAYSIKNLDENETDYRFTISSSDNIAPTVQLTQKPTEYSDLQNVTFTWTGQDNVSLESNLVYQYFLEGYDINWSDWSNTKTINYDLPNGFYKFILNSKDETGNVSNVPLEYSFVVNASPKIESFEKFENAVWACKMVITNDSPANSDKHIVLLPKHSLANIESIVPIRLYRLNESNPCGALDKIAKLLGLDTVFISQNKGFVFNIPDEFPDSNKLEYIIEWGNKAKFGWQETKYLPKGFPNLFDNPPYNSDISNRRFLDDNQNLWRIATTIKTIQTDNSHVYSSWTYFDKSNTNDAIINQKELEYLEGSWKSGEKYTSVWCKNPTILKIENNINIFIRESKFERNYTPSSQEDFDYDRYVIKILELDGEESKSIVGDWKENVRYLMPSKSVANKIWLLNRFYGDVNNSLSFTIIDKNGNVIADGTELYSIVRSHFIYEGDIFDIGDNNVIIIFGDSWQTEENDDRSNLCFQIRESDGTLIKPTTIINPPLLDETIEEDDAYHLGSAITDVLGRVWISYVHDIKGNEYFYIVLNTDGSVINGPNQTDAVREFKIVDRDGYVWATEGGSIYLLDQDLNEQVFSNQSMPIPNQNVGNILANVNYDNYRIFDRWSSNIFAVNINDKTQTNGMELFSLPINEDIQLENVSIGANGNNLYYNEEPLPEYTEVSLADKISLGSNTFSIAQSSLLGGDLIISFPIKMESTATFNIFPDSKNISIYPNPVNDILHMETQDNSPLTISIYNSLGILVKSKIVSDKMINVSALLPGIYLIEIHCNGEAAKKLKFIKS